jgi:hypothetical protein
LFATRLQYRFSRLPLDDGSILHRTDGWLVSDGNASPPLAIALQIARNLPVMSEVELEATTEGADTVRDIRQRMRSRQNIFERNRKL